MPSILNKSISLIYHFLKVCFPEVSLYISWNKYGSIDCIYILPISTMYSSLIFMVIIWKWSIFEIYQPLIDIVSFYLSVSEYHGEILKLKRVQRHQMGAYLCIASNTVPPSVSKRIRLNVNCKYFYQVHNKLSKFKAGATKMARWLIFWILLQSSGRGIHIDFTKRLFQTLHNIRYPCFKN